MDAIDLYRRAHDAGLHIRANGDKLLIGPHDRLTPELRQMLRDHKPALLAFLAEARKTTTALIAAAMRACDHYNDGDAAREQMRADCLATPAHLQADLLDHFQQTYGAKP